MAAAALLALLAAACSTTPDYERPAVPDMPGAWRTPLAGATLPAPTSQWWEKFGSEELNRLERLALERNHDLRAAVERIVQSAALAGIAETALLPVIQFSAGTQRRSPAGGGLASSGGLSGRQSESTYQLGLQASYEIDLWGKNRAAASSALATAQTSVYERETVVMTLTADVAATYVQYLGLVDRLGIARHNVENMRRVLGIISKRVEIGEGAEVELAQQRGVLAQAEAVVPVVALQVEQTRNRLALLVGLPPEALTLTGTTLDGLRLPRPAPGLPSDILRRRPDIRRAEFALIAANEAIGVEVAKLLPSFTLTDQMGVGSTVLGFMLSPGGFLYTLAANAVQTVFDAGKTRRQIEFSESKFRELVEAYQQSILNALRDVENALAGVHWTGQQVAAQQQSVQHSLRASQLSRLSYQIGQIEYLSVLEIERTLFNERDKDIQARLSNALSVIDLFKALGGGFEDSDQTPPRGRNEG
jgi:NodT family efflux transporter outer membrane factor (OMF) lipoprotein